MELRATQSCMEVVFVRGIDPSKRKLVVSRDVVFEEDRCWDWQEGAAAASSEEATFTVHYLARGADVEASPITETGEVAVTPTTP